MSGTERGALPSDADARDVMAGEYVMGTLDARTAQRVAVAVQSDPAWQLAVEAWETRFAPLIDLARPEKPPPDTWDRIAALVAPRRAEPARVMARPALRAPGRFAWLWRGWAIGTTLATAGLAAFVLYPRQQPPRVMTVLITDRNAPAFVADVDRTGSLRLAPLAAANGRLAQAPSGRSLQLWGLPPGATAPVSMGVLPHEPPKLYVVPSSAVHPGPGLIIEVSLEPEGGSPTGKPTGPVIFFGRLAEVLPDT